MSTQDIGFAIGPRLNAAGRLDDMSIGVRCLLTADEDEAVSLARLLNDFNQKRRTIEQDMRASADAQLQAEDIASQHQNQFSVCLMDENWHEGVIGILAGRIKEALHRPCIVFTSDGQHGLKGSARSIQGVHIRDVLQAIVARHPGMIDKFGGHAMAAGLSLPREYYEPFREAFEEAVRQALGERIAAREYLVDGSLTARERNLANACLLANLMPWGQGFEAPLFADDFRVVRQKVVGRGHLKLTLADQDGGSPMDAIAFNCAAEVNIGDLLRVVYAMEANIWQDRQRLQLRVLHLEPLGLR
jgi:single-stranded-DNA-specific exonuclease